MFNDLQRKLRNGITPERVGSVIGIGITVVVVMGLVAVVLWGGSSLFNQLTTKPLATGEYALVFDKDGHITDTIQAPARVGQDAIVLHEELAGPQVWQFDSILITDGEEERISSTLTASVSFDSAVTYFNRQVDAGNVYYTEPYLRDFWYNTSLEDEVMSEVLYLLDQAWQNGDLPRLQYTTDGSPTTVLNEEVATQYLADKAAQAAAQAQEAAETAAFDARKALFLADIEKICQKYSDANRFYPELCPESNGPGVAPSQEQNDPGSPSPTVNNSNGGEGGDISPPEGFSHAYYEASFIESLGDVDYEFACTTIPIILTNGDAIANAIKSVIQADLVHVTALQKMDLTSKAALPCSVISPPSDGAVSNSSDDPSGSAAGD